MTYTVKKEDVGKRLDAYLAEMADISRSAAAKLIESGSVTVLGKTVEKKHQVKENDLIELVIPEAEEYEAQPEDIPLNVVYEDSDIIVITSRRAWWSILRREITRVHSSTLCSTIARTRFRALAELCALV